MSTLHSSFKKKTRVMGIWRKVFRAEVLQERGEKLCLLLWEAREKLSVKCKDRTVNFNLQYLHQNEKGLGINFKIVSIIYFSLQTEHILVIETLENANNQGKKQKRNQFITHITLIMLCKCYLMFFNIFTYHKHLSM